jgi:hypothetical protein
VHLMVACKCLRYSAGPEGLLEAEQAGGTSWECPEISPGHRLVTMLDATKVWHCARCADSTAYSRAEGLSSVVVLQTSCTRNLPYSHMQCKATIQKCISAESMLWSLLAERLPAASSDGCAASWPEIEAWRPPDRQDVRPGQCPVQRRQQKRPTTAC